MSKVIRVTMFKVPEANILRFIDLYKTLGTTAKKDGKPYIVSLQAGRVYDNEPRANGYTLVAKTEFSSLDDMDYYANKCAAHNALRMAVKDLNIVGDPLTVYFTPSVEYWVHAEGS